MEIGRANAGDKQEAVTRIGLLSALRHADQIVLGHMMVQEKSNEIPAAPELIEALGLRGCVFTLDAEHCQKNCSSA